MEHYGLWINGEAWESGQQLVVTDKASGAPWATISQAGPKEVDAAVSAAVQAFAGKPLTATQRYDMLMRAASLIRACSGPPSCESRHPSRLSFSLATIQRSRGNYSAQQR